MNEIIFSIEEPRKGGFTARSLGHSIYSDVDKITELHDNVREAIAVILRRKKNPALFACILFVMKSLPHETVSQLVKRLETFDYRITRQTGSHIRVTTLGNL